MTRLLQHATIFCILLLTTTVFASSEILVLDDFNSGLKENWQRKDFNGQTLYRIVTLEDEKVLLAESEAAASALVFETEYELRDYPVLSWRWKINNIHPKGDSQTKAGDDYAARIYVVFPHWFTPMTRSINYIWANKLPKGSHTPSRYTANSVMLATQSGPENRGRWITERRNVREDYRKIFGEDPPTVGAIAIMTDSDDTGGSAIAWYDDIRIEKEQTP